MSLDSTENYPVLTPEEIVLIEIHSDLLEMDKKLKISEKMLLSIYEETHYALEAARILLHKIENLKLHDRANQQ